MFVLLVTVATLRWISPYTHAKGAKASMYNNPQNSDIQFRSLDRSQVIYAHKSILAASSPVFNEMFYGESSGRTRRYMSEISEDYNQESIAAFILFIYTEECPKNIEFFLNVLQLIKKYQVPSFETTCKSSLEFDTPWSAFKVIEKLLEAEAKEMTELWWTRIESRIDEVIASEYFLNINQRTLTAFLERETLCYPEIDLFHAVIRWSEYQCMLQKMWITNQNQRKVLGDSVFGIRFLSMTEEEFKKHVVSSGVLTVDEVQAIVETMRSGHPGVDNYKYNWALQARNKRAWYCQYFNVKQLENGAIRMIIMLFILLLPILIPYFLSLEEEHIEQQVKEDEAEDKQQKQKQEQYQKQQQKQKQP